jgi:integrase
MSNSHSGTDRRIGSHSNRQSPRHSKDDALDDREFQRLLEACYRLDDDYYQLETRTIVLLTGRLGLRVGELTHLDESWINWRDRMLEIPRYDPCTNGRNGGVCGHCTQLAKQQVAHSGEDEALDLETALKQRWQSKTEAAAREIPFDFDPRVELALEHYFDRFDQYQGSHSAVHRRLDRAAERVDGLDADAIYPHCLRATAASYHASRGLDALALQALLGWADLSTAHRYVRRSGTRTRRALNATHSR